MSSAVAPGVLQAIPSPGIVPAATPGTLGANDAQDPALAVVVGAAADAIAPAALAGRPTTVAGGRHATACFATQALPQGLQLDLDAFVAAYKSVQHEAVFTSLTSQERIDNLKRFIDSMATDPTVDTVFKASYILATAMHEGRSARSAWQMTWAPVSESAGNGASYWTAVYVRDLKGQPLDENGDPIDPCRPSRTPRASSISSRVPTRSRMPICPGTTPRTS